MKPFSRMEAMRFGWETVENNLRFFIPFYILFLLSFYVVYFVVYFIGLLISEITGLNQVLVDVVSLIVSYLFLLLLSLGFIKVSLKFYDGERASFGDLFSQYRLFFGASFAVIIYILAVFRVPKITRASAGCIYVSVRPSRGRSNASSKIRQAKRAGFEILCRNEAVVQTFCVNRRSGLQQSNKVAADFVAPVCSVCNF